MKQDDENAFRELVRRNGTVWIVEQLQEIGEPQLLLLHLANSLADDPRNADDSRLLLGLSEKLDEQYGFWGTLNNALWELHANGYPMEPKTPRYRGIQTRLREKTETVFECLRKGGHKIEGETVVVRYTPDSDPYIGLEAADLAEEIRSLAAQHGVQPDDLDRGIAPLYGLGAGSA